MDPRLLGLLLPVGGPQAGWGLQARQGAQLALETANASLPEGQRMAFAVEDEGANTKNAVAALERLAKERQVLAVLGPLSSDASFASLTPSAEQRLPLLSPAAIRPDLEGISPYFFRNSLTPEKQAAAMAEHAYFGLKVTRVAALYPGGAYASTLMRSFSSRFSQLGGSVVMSVSYPAGTSDFKDLAVALGGLDPGIIKLADMDEKRDQQAKVEAASTRLGRVLLAAVQDAPASLSLSTRVAVVDFSCSTAAAQINAGRAFSDRFWRVLSQLEKLQVIPPDEAASDRAMSADFILSGSVTDLALVPGADRQVFHVTAQLFDAHQKTVVAVQQFDVSKLLPPPSNSMGLQAVYFAGTATEAQLAASAFVFCDMKLPLLGSDLMDRPQILKGDELDALDGSRFTSGFFMDSADPVVRAFVEAYKRRYAAVPTPLAACAYDAASLLLALAREGAATRDELRHALLKVRDFHGVTGMTSFDGRQDADKKIPILKVNSMSRTLEQIQ